MTTLETRAAFATYMSNNSLALNEIISRYHKMLDGSCTASEILPPSVWEHMNHHFRMFLCYNVEDKEENS